MNDGKINFEKLAEFQPKQLQAWFTLLDPNCKYLLYGGAAHGGKSYFLRWAAIGLGMYYFAKYGFKRVSIGLFSEDYPTLKDRQVIKIKNEIPPFLGKLVESRDEGYAFIGSKQYGEFIVLLRNLDDPSKYSSTEFAAELVEELTKNKESTFDDLRFRLRYPGINDVKFIGATNPGDIGHGFVKRKWVKPDTNYPDIEQNRFFFVPSNYSDNKFTTEDYVQQLKALPEAKRKAYMEGSWDEFSGQYFTEWRDKLHVIPSFIPNKEITVIVGGMDWGRTNPFAFELSTVEKTYFEDYEPFYRSKTFLEAYGTNLLPSEWSDKIKEKLKYFGLTLSDIEWVQADPKIFVKGDDGSISIADQFIEADERWRTILKPASNDRIGGWENMHKWLDLAPDGLPYSQWTQNCANAIRTIPELVHDEIKVEDVDTHGEDHAGDAERYKFKNLKHLDGRVGGVKQRQEDTKDKFYFAPMDEGKQIAIDPDMFK